MRAWTYTHPGPPTTALTYTTSHPNPRPLLYPQNLPRSSLLIKISHCGFNGGVLLIMALLPSYMHSTPAIPELDFSGEIVSLGKDVDEKRLKAGMRVFGCCHPLQHFTSGAGTLAEYVVVSADMVCEVPRGMGLDEAAGLGGCGCTAIQLISRANIIAGQKVFINGASGGLGSILVQVVKAAVGESGIVVATCSTPKIDFVKGLGVDEVIDYTNLPSSQPLHTYLQSHPFHSKDSQPFDSIIDCVGIQSLYTSSPDYLSKRGIFINAGGLMVQPNFTSFIGFFWTTLLNMTYPSFLPTGVPRRYGFLSGHATPAALSAVKELVEDGKLKVPVDSVWEMEDALRGYERMTSRSVKGKVIVHVQDV